MEILHNRYRIEEEIGRSSTSMTWRGYDQQTNRWCAIKQLDMNRIGSVETMDLLEREANVLSHLQHSNIPKFIDFFTEETQRGFHICLVWEYVPAQPKLWFCNEERNVVETPMVAYQNSRFRILNLPEGKIGISVMLDANPNNPGSYPGDMRAWQIIDVRHQENPEVIINMETIIHLTAPQDNGTVMERWDADCMEKMSWASPVQFEWEPVGPGVVYEIRITRMDCLNRYNSVGTVVDTQTSNTRLTLHLLESLPNECYGFHIRARKNTISVGMLITHGNSGLGWDYRFRVRKGL